MQKGLEDAHSSELNINHRNGSSEQDNKRDHGTGIVGGTVCAAAEAETLAPSAVPSGTVGCCGTADSDADSSVDSGLVSPSVLLVLLPPLTLFGLMAGSFFGGVLASTFS